MAESTLQFLNIWVESVWGILVDSAVFFLVGLILAGLVHLVLNEKNLVRLMGRSRRRQVFRAALVGVPLPLCSCSVLPVAGQLRNSGVSRAGTVSFLVATPESSVDSVMLTWSLTDPLLTIARPVTAFLTAAIAGLTEASFEENAAAVPLPAPVAGCDDCGCKTDVPTARSSLMNRIMAGQKHAFTTLIGDLAPYLLVGYLLAGLVAALTGAYLIDPPSWITGGWLAYIGVILLGVPLYMCATSSTPLAAVLLAAGFPPGAILVFLLVGPATNLAALAVLKRILGLPGTIRYLISIVTVSVACGLVLDWVYEYFGVSPDYAPGSHQHTVELLYVASAIIVGSLILLHSAKRLIRR